MELTLPPHLPTPSRRHLTQRERRGSDGSDAERGRGEPEEHLVACGAQSPGDAAPRRGSAGGRAAAVPGVLARQHHQEPAAQQRLLPAVGVMAAAAQVCHWRSSIRGRKIKHLKVTLRRG